MGSMSENGKVVPSVAIVTKDAKSEQIKTILKWIITFGVPLIVAFMEPTAGLKKPMLMFLAVTLWAMFCWMFNTINETIVGFILPVLYIVVGVAKPEVAFAPWLTNVPWIVFGGTILGAAMMSTGLAKRIAFRAILLTGGTFKRTLTGILIGGLILAPVIPSVMAKITIFSVIGVAICQALDLKPKSRAAGAVMMTSFIAVAGPKLSYLTGAADNTMAMGLVAKVTGHMISWGQFALHNAVIGIAYSFISLGLIFLFLKPEQEIDSLEVIKSNYKELGSISADEKKMIAFLAFTTIMMVTDTLHKIDVGWILMIVGALLFFPKLGVLQAEKLSKLNFTMVFFVCGAMSIGTVAAKVGIVKIFAGILLPMLQGSHLYTFMSVYFFGVVMKFFLTPLAATAMFMTTIAETAQKLGLHPYSLVYVFKYGIDQYVFPYEYAVLLFCYSFGYMSLNHVFRVMIPRIITTALFLALIAFPYWKFFGLFN